MESYCDQGKAQVGTIWRNTLEAKQSLLKCQLQKVLSCYQFSAHAHCHCLGNVIMQFHLLQYLEDC